MTDLADEIAAISKRVAQQNSKAGCGVTSQGSAMLT